MPWLDINQERHHCYMGYIGMVELMAEIDKTLYNPVWEQVRKPAPWAVAGDSWQDRAMAQIAEEEAELAADPVKAEAARRAAAVCICKSVTLGVIEDAIQDFRLTTVEGVREKTQASAGCGACSIRIEEILEDAAQDESVVGVPTEATAVAAE
jgi:nitrogenase molybdenum-cofactor synthesis protein NifE